MDRSPAQLAAAAAALAADAGLPARRSYLAAVPSHAVVAATFRLVEAWHRRPVTADADECGLVGWARTELELAGLFDPDSDYDGMLGEACLEIIRMFADQGHSGFSAGLVTSLLERLLRYEPITPLTYAPDEWNHVAGPPDGPWHEERGVWQNRRDSAVFSNDGGATWYSVNDPDRIVHPGWSPARAAAPDVGELIDNARAHLAAIDPDQIERDERGRFAPKGGGSDGSSDTKELKGEIPGQGGLFGTDGIDQGGLFDAPQPAPEPPPAPSSGATIAPHPDSKPIDELVHVPRSSKPGMEGAAVALREIAQLHGMPRTAEPIVVKSSESGKFVGAYASSWDLARQTMISHDIRMSAYSPTNVRGGGAFVAAHEMGHYIAMQMPTAGFNVNGRPCDAAEITAGYNPKNASDDRVLNSRSPEHWQEFWRTVDSTGAQQRRDDSTFGQVRANQSYYRDPSEVWARAYSQWVATKSPDVRDAMNQGEAHVSSVEDGIAWTDAEMEVLGPAVEAVLRGEGLAV